MGGPLLAQGCPGWTPSPIDLQLSRLVILDRMKPKGIDVLRPPRNQPEEASQAQEPIKSRLKQLWFWKLYLDKRSILNRDETRA